MAAPFIRKLLNTFLCLSQVLSNAVYVLFIAQNIKPVILLLTQVRTLCFPLKVGNEMECLVLFSRSLPTMGERQWRNSIIDFTS